MTDALVELLNANAKSAETYKGLSKYDYEVRKGWNLICKGIMMMIIIIIIIIINYLYCLGTEHEGVSNIFQTGCLERELQMVQLSTTRCSCIAIL
jgi:hypothetical protein